jgi:hypothetical protein
MHRHEHGRVIIPIQGGTMKIVTQAGASETHQWDVGNAYWLGANKPGEMHADVNATRKPQSFSKRKAWRPKRVRRR